MRNALQFEIYRAKDGWRWRGKRNGKITCESGEGYKRRSSCRKSLIGILGAIIDRRYESPKNPADVEFG